MLFGEVVDGKRQVLTLTLRVTADSKVRRQVKLRGEVNPYFSRWQVYLESRHHRIQETLAPDWPLTHPLPAACGGTTKRNLTASPVRAGWGEAFERLETQVPGALRVWAEGNPGGPQGGHGC